MTSKTKKLVRVKREGEPRRRLTLRFDMDAFAGRMNTWSRPLRIAIATLTAVLWVGLLIAILNAVLPADSFQDPDSAFNIVLGLSIFGMVLYGVGWALLVGFDLDPDQPWQAKRPAVYYLLSGGIALTLIVLGVIVGVFYAFVL